MTDTPDEAQTQPPPPPPPPSNDPEMFEFSIDIRMDATVAVNGTDWIKPGASSGLKWRIRNGLLPSRDELELGMGYIQEGVLGPVLAEMIDLIGQRVVELQNKR